MASRRNFPNVLTKGLLLVCLFCAHYSTYAKEGMWIPATLKAREKDMQSMGLQIPVDRLYNTDGTGLNNAVVLFGRGCTGEVISPQGLVLTNHHCGYGSVQGLSSTEKDYFANGFFAQNRNEEIPCPGLTVTFIRRMENVTEKVVTGISDTLKDAIRDSMISGRIKVVEKEFATAYHLDAQIKPYYDGNQYWVAITETYKDIRLVGFPPNGIGAFGGDVENWMWPRHTGDFSLFRIYAGADNKPANFATGNQPYRADQYFKINAGGYKEGDFTMVYGFPGTTQEYISSYELKQVYKISDPIAIAARTRKLDVWTKHMSADRDIFIKYTSKRAGVANGWKKWQGEVKGLKINMVTKKKQKFEKTFNRWANKQETLPEAGGLLSSISMDAEESEETIEQGQYLQEAVIGIELIQQGAAIQKIIQCFMAARANEQSHTVNGVPIEDTIKKLITEWDGFYKNYDPETDKDVFIELMGWYVENCADWMPKYFKREYERHNKDLRAWADEVYSNSAVVSKTRLMQFVESAMIGQLDKLIKDPALLLSTEVTGFRNQRIVPVLKKHNSNMRYLNRQYMKAQMAMQPDKAFYPNANLTLRLSYGTIDGLDPDGSAPYSFQTTLGEAVALDDTATEIFRVPPKLKALYKAKDYGKWGVNGTMPLAFTASNHTSGGNSGSPVLNAKGELIGTNFDRAYEGTMSDYYFDPNRCRNISVDIRYTLFIIEKFGGAAWVIDELGIVGK